MSLTKLTKCLVCKKEFTAFNSLQRKYCSCSCYIESKKGVPSKKKNGLYLKCVCGKEFYAAKRQLNSKKYCSKICANRNIWKTREKERECSICSKTYKYYSSNASGVGICSYDCAKTNNRNKQLKYIEFKKKITKVVSCRFCRKKIETNEYCPINFCGGKTGECLRSFMSKKRKGLNNPAYRNGSTLGRNNLYTSIHLRACTKYKKEFLKQNEYLFCESCKVNQNGTPKFETHHIYYASLYPKHKELHNPKNLILLCIKCHNEFHSNKRQQEFLEIEKMRGLKELFKVKN